MKDKEKIESRIKELNQILETYIDSNKQIDIEEYYCFLDELEELESIKFNGPFLVE